MAVYCNKPAPPRERPKPKPLRGLKEELKEEVAKRQRAVAAAVAACDWTKMVDMPKASWADKGEVEKRLDREVAEEQHIAHLKTCPFDPSWTPEEEAEWARAQDPVEFEPVDILPRDVKRRILCGRATALACLVAFCGIPLCIILLHFGVI